MIKRALCVALGLAGALFPAAAQQLPSTRAFDPAFMMSLYQPRISSAGSSSLLFHQGPVTTWWDGGWLANENALSEIGMASLDLFPVSFLPPEVFGPVSGQKRSPARGSRSGNSGTDGKDFPGEILESPLDRFYYGGEIGVLYGQWTGKGGGDLFETYVVGTVGNDKFQITAGAAYQEWSGRTLRFRSFAAPR
jgi:hypothetical protein